MSKPEPMIHVPVLSAEVLALLAIQADDVILDGTLGFGGHASQLLAQLGPQGHYIGLDQDPEAITHCEDKFKDEPRVTIARSNFSDFEQVLSKIKVTKLNKVLLDLGMSSFHLDSSKRGFSFQKDEPLDMRMNPDQAVTAKQILERYSEQALSDLFFQLGDLHHNKRLVAAIVNARRRTPKLLDSTNGLKSLIRDSYQAPRHVMIKISSQVFQALRIEVNREFEVLTVFLEKLAPYLASDARVGVITFHSGEDRLVKQFVAANRDTYEKVTKKVVQASQTEIRENSRAKPAKLRVFKKK